MEGSILLLTWAALFCEIQTIHRSLSETHRTRKEAEKCAISTPVIQFTSRVALRDDDLGGFANTADLDLFRGVDEVDTVEDAAEDGAGAPAGPRHRSRLQIGKFR